jgi:uncharacterized protein YcaQ
MIRARLKLTLADLRRRAVSHTLFGPLSLLQAVERLGFVQADPIRAPARAQDLILRQRVKGYRVGDLDASYHEVGLEEDFLYAYGFMPSATWRLIHPRRPRALTAGEKRVLEIVSKHERIHPRDLEAHLGRRRQINGWGGYSKATTRSLQALHYLGLLRIAGREKGVRLYAPTIAAHAPLSTPERLQKLILLLISILAPLPERSFQNALYHLGYAIPNERARRCAAEAVLASADLVRADVDGVRYLWPARPVPKRQPPEKVRFLAPFDPLVWDRRRFEHLWGWAYRFEAYTPVAKRKLGYYALPLLWKTDVIGWVNIARAGKNLAVKPGYVAGAPPSQAAFRSAFDEEVESFRRFLQPRPSIADRREV